MQVISIPLEKIEEDRNQPRAQFNETALAELIDSIREVGLLNPIKVAAMGDGQYKIIFGNRRFKACQVLGIPDIPCIIAENVDELDIYLEQLTENIQRQSFSPIEEARAYVKLLENEGWKISTKLLASKLGKSERYISRKIDLLIFGDQIKSLITSSKDIAQNQLTEEQALALKHVRVEYRDHLARKIADYPVAVEDVKKIAELFSTDEISASTREIILQKTPADIVHDWAEYQESIRRKPKNVVQRPRVVEQDTQHVTLDNLLPEETLIEAEFKRIFYAIPSCRPLSIEIHKSVQQLKLPERQELLTSVNVLLDNLRGHVEQWQRVADSLGASAIKLVEGNGKVE